MFLKWFEDGFILSVVLHMFAVSCNIHRISKSAEEGLYGDHFGLESETALIMIKYGWYFTKTDHQHLTKSDSFYKVLYLRLQGSLVTNIYFYSSQFWNAASYFAENCEK